MTLPNSGYLSRPLRSEEEVRAARRKKCRLCSGSGRAVEKTVYGRNLYPCPVCSPESREEGNG